MPPSRRPSRGTPVDEINPKTEVQREIAPKDLRQQGNGNKRGGQTSPARDQCSVVGWATDPARDATRRDPVWRDRGVHFLSGQNRLRGSGSATHAGSLAVAESHRSQ